jgi:hypothetical protein
MDRPLVSRIICSLTTGRVTTRHGNEEQDLGHDNIDS